MEWFTDKNYIQNPKIITMIFRYSWNQDCDILLMSKPVQIKQVDPMKGELKSFTCIAQIETRIACVLHIQLPHTHLTTKLRHFCWHGHGISVNDIYREMFISKTRQLLTYRKHTHISVRWNVPRRMTSFVALQIVRGDGQNKIDWG